MRMRIGMLSAAALWVAVMPASVSAQPAKPSPTAQQQSQWAEQLGRFTMASTWLRRCPTELQFRQRAAQTAEQILAEYFHAAGMSEPVHQQGKKLGREAALGVCTDTVKAKAAGRISAEAFLMLTAKAPDLATVTQNFLLTGSVDDSPCGVARGRTFGARPDQTRVRAEIDRAKAEAGISAEVALAAGVQINEGYARPELCSVKKGWIPIILSGWSDTYAGIQDFSTRVQSQEYGDTNSWIWRVEGQRSNSVSKIAGIYVPCRTHTPTLDQMVSNYACDLMVLGSDRTALVATVGPICEKGAKCLSVVRKVMLQLFTDPKAAASRIFVARATGKGKYRFDAEALQALLDPKQPALVAQVVVAGVNADGKAFEDGFPVRGTPPGFLIEDFQDGFSWTFAPASVVN